MRITAAITKPFRMAVDYLQSIRRERKQHLAALKQIAEDRELIAARGREFASK